MSWARLKATGARFPTAAFLSIALLSTVKSAEEVSWREIGRSVEIIGRLGVPLGKIVKIEATLIGGSEAPRARFDHRLSAFNFRYLRVESVAGASSVEKPVMEFFVEHPVGSIDEADQDRPEPSNDSLGDVPLGSRLVLYAYERGGTPINPRHDEMDVGFQFISTMPEPDDRANPHFRTVLHVVVEGESLPPVENKAESRSDSATGSSASATPPGSVPSK